MAVTGTWKNRTFYVDPQQAVLHQADPEHARQVAADPTVGAWGAPPILSDHDADFIHEQAAWVVQTDGWVADLTPTSHQDGNDLSNYADQFTPAGSASNPGDVAYLAASASAHGQDYGSPDRQNHATTMPFDDFTTRYEAPRFEGVGPIDLPQLVGGGMRGLNSYDVNNPGLEMYEGRGYRPGWVEQFFVARKMYDPQRVHDPRWNLVDTPYAESDAPVPVGAGPYNSPFSSLARMITNVNQTPMIRREPPPVDQDIITDGTAETDAASDYESWVVG